MYFDTHAHYDDERFDPDRDELVASLPEKGVELVLDAACDLPTAYSAAALAERYAHVYAAAGIHPHDADTASDAALAEIENLCRTREKVVAVGEIGLDYHYDFSPRETQREALYKQLELARALDLPVILHDREAHEDCMKAVRAFPGLRGVFHCYSGSVEMARELLRLGWYLSFTGSVTFKNARRAPEVVAAVPDDRLMIETDCPYMTPVPHRGERNDSTYLPYTAAAIAAMRGTSVEAVAELTLRNGRTFFGIRP